MAEVLVVVEASPAAGVKKVTLEMLTLADLGIDAGEVGLAGATSAVVGFRQRPPRSGGTKITDDGTGGAQLVEFLASEKFV